MTNQQIIAKVNQWQNFEYVHPLTCGNESRHENLVPKEVNGKVILFCIECRYTQDHIPTLVLSNYVEEFQKFLKDAAE